MKNQTFANSIYTEMENVKNLREELITLNAPTIAIKTATDAIQSMFNAYMVLSSMKDKEEE